MTTPILGHEKWFTDPTSLPADGLHVAPNAMLAAAVAGAITLVGWLLWRARGRRDVIPGPARLGATPEGRRRFYAIAPLLLAAHLAVTLFSNGIDGRLLAPNNSLAAPWTFIMGLAQMAVALGLVYGAFTRPAAALLAAIWLAGIPLCGLEAMADNIVYLGFAAFFWTAGRGPYSVDALLFPRLTPQGGSARLAMPSLRLGLSLSLITLAFTEKLANLALAEAFLRDHPVNFTAFVGMPMTDRQFAIWAGGVELTVGLLLLFGVFPRVVILLAWLPFNASLLVFRGAELIGHLPFYCTLALLLVWTPDEEDERLFCHGVIAACAAQRSQVRDPRVSSEQEVCAP